MPRKKKTEENKEEIVKKKKKDEGEEQEKEKEKAKEPEEFPDIELGIDVFSHQDENQKLKELKEKAKQLEAKIDKKPEEKDMKEEVRESEKKRRRKINNLFPLDDYVKYSAHLGTKAVTPNMRQFVYKRRADGLAVLNTNSIDEKLKEASEFLAGFSPEDIFIACKREAGWKAAKKFSEVTGIKVFTKKYPAGIITNTQLNDFFEIELVIICDPWLDKNALNDSLKVKKPVIGLCDTNNLTRGITKIVPCNNKSSKSVGLILFLLAREYLNKTGKEKEAKNLKLEEFTGVEEEIKEKAGKGASEGV